MLRASAGDNLKITKAIKAVLHAAIETCEERETEDDEDATEYILNTMTCRHVYVNHRDFYHKCRLQALKRINFAEEVNDTLTGTEFIKEFGRWVYTEVGDYLHVFVFLGVMQPDESLMGMLSRHAKAGTAHVHDLELDDKGEIDTNLCW